MCSEASLFTGRGGRADPPPPEGGPPGKTPLVPTSSGGHYSGRTGMHSCRFCKNIDRGNCVKSVKILLLFSYSVENINFNHFSKKILMAEFPSFVCS